MAGSINSAVGRRRVKRTSIVAKAPGLAAIFALLLSAYSLGLVMLGYGYDLAYLGEFGLSPEFLQRTPLDFLMRSYKPIAGMAPHLSAMWRFDGFSGFMQRLLLDGGLLYWALAVGALISVGAWIYCLRTEKRVLAVLTQLRHSRTLHSLAVLCCRIRQKFTGPRIVGWFGWLLPSALLSAGALTLYLILAFVSSLVFLFLVTAPMMGVSIGRDDAQAVLQAKGCDTDVAGKTACVRILKNDCEVARGRLIDIAGNRVFLYPLDAKAKEKRFASFPLDGNVFESYRDGDAPEFAERLNSCANPAI